MDLCGKVAVITGGKRIGRVVAQELAQHGMNLVLSYRGSKEEAEQTAADVEAAGRRATIVSADVSKPADCLGIFDQALATFGRVDVLINMASIYRSKPLQEVTVDYWTTDLDVNLRSAFLCAHAAIPLMRGVGGGRIVNFADWLVRSGRPRYTGFTPNRVAALGENLILLVNLAWTAWLHTRFLRHRGSFAALERWQIAYLPVYAVWAALVVVMFPPLFGYR